MLEAKLRIPVGIRLLASSSNQVLFVSVALYFHPRPLQCQKIEIKSLQFASEVKFDTKNEAKQIFFKDYSKNEIFE